MNGAQLLKKAIKDADIKYVFGYTGGAIMPFYDEAERGEEKLEIIQARNEQGATYMAQGVTRGSYSNKEKQIGVALSTSGPGAMNLVTGVADAIMDSVAIITISGQVASGTIGTDAFQETDVVGVMMPITKQVYMPLKADHVEENFHEALYISRTGRPGPVHIDIPKDIQFGSTDEVYKFDFKKYKPRILDHKVRLEPDFDKLNDAVDLINKAERPVIFSGHGVKISNAGDKLLKFAETINAPISTTLHGNSSIPSNHRLNLGMMGMHGTVEANRAIQNADLIISFGMRFDDRVTGKLSEYAKDADVIHIEIDPSEIDKNVKTTIGIDADVNITLEKFNKRVDLISKERKEWFKLIQKYKDEMGQWHQEELERGTGKEDRLLMKTVISKLSKVTKGDDILVMDVGQHQMITNRYYSFNKINTAFNSGGAGTMGASLPMSIGVKLVRPDEVVWSISGDGGFQMNIQELGTIMQYGIDVKIVIMNNRFLGMVKQWQTLFFEDNYSGTPMHNPNFGKIAEGYGIPYRNVSKVDEIEDAFNQARNHKGAYMLEFECDSSEIVLPMIPTGSTFDKMIVNPEDVKKFTN
jgi:acetolactate synthase I/II/III large subunit